MNFIHACHACFVLFVKNTVAIVYLQFKQTTFLKVRRKKMKILLQPEARTISNEELAKNQKDLVNMLTKVYRFAFKLPIKANKTMIKS